MPEGVEFPKRLRGSLAKFRKGKSSLSGGNLTKRALREGFPDVVLKFSEGILKMKMESQPGFPTGDSFSAYSALHLLRNYNQIFLPSGNNLVQVYHNYPCGTSISDLPRDNLPLPTTFPFSPLVGAFHPYSHYPLPASPDLKSRQALFPGNIYGRRPRGEKKPIPEDQKDDRYYERRKRNNQAAKKSRDARKLREDQIALKATLLEHENAILRAQLLTLKEETESLRQVILSEKKPLGFMKKELKEDAKWDFESVKDVNKIVKL